MNVKPIEDINKNDIDKQEIKEKEKQPLTNFDIKDYLGQNAKIVVYSDLKKYKSIEDLLPNNNSYFVLLYQDSAHSGHWVSLLRKGDTIIFFDPYGLYCDDELKWIDPNTRQGLGIKKKYLSDLLNDFDGKINYNKVKYQSENPDISTCGKHTCFWLYNAIQKDKTLVTYYKLMNKLKNKLGLSYDGVVTAMVDPEDD